MKGRRMKEKREERTIERRARRFMGSIEQLYAYARLQDSEGKCCENISRSEYQALRTALRQDMSTMQDIARSAAVTKSGATRLLARLEGKGLACRIQDEKDGRICCVVLTKEGRSLLESIEKRLTDKISYILKSLDPALAEILVIGLEAFVRAAQQRSDRELTEKEPIDNDIR